MLFLRTQRNWAGFFCRIAIAAVFIPHGVSKLVKFEPLGWEGPQAWADTVLNLLQIVPIPEQYKLILAQTSAWVEVVAAGSCILGFLVRLCILPLIADQAFAIALVHGANGFWIDHKLDGVIAPGFEYNVVLIIVCLALLFSGAGALSLDRLIAGGPEYDEYEEEEVEYEEAPADHQGGRHGHHAHQ